jgi:hypothetical protein
MAHEVPPQDRSSPSQNQAIQEELVRQARREPGVAEALAAYEAILLYLPPQPTPGRPQIRYATGGNS